jgi:hypothetical protein
MKATEASRASLERQLEPLVTREITGIAAIDAAIAHESAPDYVVMFQDAKNGKQANVEQMVTLIRMLGGTPDERGGLRKTFAKTQASIAARVSTTKTLQTMRVAEIELITLYADSVATAEGLAKRALRKALGRALVQSHLLTAHIAKRTNSAAEAQLLPAPLDDYFAGADPRACIRCHLDRPGRSGPLERTDPHPYTYLCAACHDEVVGEWPPDLASQVDRWPRQVREAKVLQHGLGRVSRLNAMGRSLHPLAGLEPELPTPAAERAVIIPAMTPSPGPEPTERGGALTIVKGEGLEGEYIDELFTASRVWRRW